MTEGTQKAIEFLEQKLKDAEISDFCKDTTALNEWRLPSAIEAWHIQVKKGLAFYFGEKSSEVKNFDSAFIIAGLYNKFWGVDDADRERKRREECQNIIERAKAILNATLNNTKTFGISKPQDVTKQLAKVFIAHGGTSQALNKVCDFLRALSIKPLIAEDAASEGRSVNEQVKWCLDNSDCVIILGTADDKELKDGKLYPRRNVHIEIGRVLERFPNRVIYLLEKEASFPSNISEKVYERFTQTNMEMAFIKVAKELTKFGVIRSSSGKESNA